MALRTLPQLVAEHIARTSALVNDPFRMTQEAEALLARIAERMRQDPALDAYAKHIAGALQGALLAVPPALHASCMHSLVVQALMEWEDLNIAFDKQLAPAA